MTESFLYALIDKPQYDKNECEDCVFVAKAVGNIQEGVVGLEASRLMWLDPEGI